jgi:hypothetical protein
MLQWVNWSTFSWLEAARRKGMAGGGWAYSRRTVMKPSPPLDQTLENRCYCTRRPWSVLALATLLVLLQLNPHRQLLVWVSVNRTSMKERERERASERERREKWDWRIKVEEVVGNGEVGANKDRWSSLHRPIYLFILRIKIFNKKRSLTRLSPWAIHISFLWILCISFDLSRGAVGLWHYC